MSGSVESSRRLWEFSLLCADPTVTSTGTSDAHAPNVDVFTSVCLWGFPLGPRIGMFRSMASSLISSIRNLFQPGGSSFFRWGGSSSSSCRSSRRVNRSCPTVSRSSRFLDHNSFVPAASTSWCFLMFAKATSNHSLSRIWVAHDAFCVPVHRLANVSTSERALIHQQEIGNKPRRPTGSSNLRLGSGDSNRRFERALCQFGDEKSPLAGWRLFQDDGWSMMNPNHFSLKTVEEC